MVTFDEVFRALTKAGWQVFVTCEPGVHELSKGDEGGIYIRLLSGTLAFRYRKLARYEPDFPDWDWTFVRSADELVSRLGGRS